MLNAMKLSQTLTCTLAAAALCAFLPHGAAAVQSATADPKLVEELAYIKALVEANMPDFAEFAIVAARKKWPSAASKLMVLELKGGLRLGNFDAAQKVVDALKGKEGQEGEYWAVRLSMADEYCSRGHMPECREIYAEFFKTVTNPDADLLDLYVESGFRWAQICVREKNFDEAVKMYGKLLEQALSDERWCTVALEDVELLLRLADGIPADRKHKDAKKRAEYIKEATKFVDKLLWKSDLILVFGKAIAMKAHIAMLRGHLGEAQALMNDYLPQLSEIHRYLVEQDPEGKRGYVRASPMPECRYLLAKMLWDAVQAEAKKPRPNEDLIRDCLFGARVGNGRNGLGAYNHAINVYVKYPESAWAVYAGEITEGIAAFVKKRYGKEIKTNITSAHIETLRKKKYQDAFELYRGQEYEKAVAAYKGLLDRVKDETEDSVRARGVLADCYVNLRQNAKADKREEYAKRAVEAEDFVATQYKGKPDALVYEAGNATLRLAAKEKGFGENARAQQLYDAYFANYPDHSNAGQVAYVLATQASKAGDRATAIRFYELLVKQYPNSLKADARSKVHLYLALEQQRLAFMDFEAAAEANDAQVAEGMRAGARKKMVLALRNFASVQKDVTDLLSSSGAKAVGEKTWNRYQLRREQAIFLLGNCLQRMPEPDPAKRSKCLAGAVKAYENYLQLYPKGQYAPLALMRIATILMAEKNVDKAQDALARLQRDFPDSHEAKNVEPLIAKMLIEMGMKSEGVAQYKKMLETTEGKYTAGQLLLAGDALLETKSWDVAGEAYAKVIERATPLTNSVFYITRALLGQAKAARGAKNYAEARQRLGEFIEKYGRSSLVIDAYDMLVDVAAMEGSREKDDALRMNAFNAAIRAIKKLRNYKKGPIAQCELDIRSGEVLLRKMEAESAMDLTDAARVTRARAIVAFRAYLMAHEPENGEAFKRLSDKEQELLKRCYEDLLPLMAAHGVDKADILECGNKYRKLFSGKSEVEAILKPLEGN